MQIKEQQQRDSIRFVWNAMAASKSLQAKTAVPQALHYRILDYNQDNLLKKLPPICSNCRAYMNPYNRVSLGKQFFTCCICKVKNAVPENYFQSKENMPLEMTLPFSTFLIAKKQSQNDIGLDLLFVVDKAVIDKQLQAIKKALLGLIDNLEDDRSVGIITYDKYVQLYDLTVGQQSTHVFSPNQQYSDVEFLDSLGLQGKDSDLNNRYLPRLAQIKQSLVQKINKIQKVKHQKYINKREDRSVGQALTVALTLANLSERRTKIIFFCGGICTVGVGKIIESDYKTQIRSIKQEVPKQSKEAREFYAKLGEKAKSRSIAIDSFIFAVEQVGLTEMIPCLTATNGLLVQHEQFASKIFIDSFNRAYLGSQQNVQLSQATDVSIEFNCSSEIALSGFQGEQVPTRYTLGNINQSSTITVLFEQRQLNTDAEAFYIQIKSTFRDSNHLNIKIQRVTTIRRLFTNNIPDLVGSFDQEAALYLLAKKFSYNSLGQSSEKIRLWLDNLLIKWTELFGIYRKGELDSFKLPNNVRAFPQFIYYLRRSSIVRKSRISLDEYSYIAEIIKRETVRNVLLLIQPALLMYTVEETSASPVGLDEKNMKSQVILILDSFFNIVEWRGVNMQGWFQNKYHLSSEYAYMRELHENTSKDIEKLQKCRFPAPTVYLTWPGHSKQRFIKSRLGNRQEEQNEGNLSEEANINAFTSRLIQIVVMK